MFKYCIITLSQCDQGGVGNANNFILEWMDSYFLLQLSLDGTTLGMTSPKFKEMWTQFNSIKEI